MRRKMKKEAMAKVDTAWLRMEQSTNLMMITSVVGLEGELDFDRLRETVENRLLAYRRFEQCAVDRGDQAFWQFDRDFRIDDHLVRIALPGKADQRELERYVSELASTPLNKAKPLWQFHVVENFAGGPVIISRIHHCIADGIALVQVLLSLTDPTPEPRPSSQRKSTWTQRRSAEASVFRRLVAPARGGIEAVAHLGKTALEEGAELVRDPEQIAELASLGGEMLAELVTAMSLGDDPDTPLKGELGPRKQVAWTEPLPLAEVKAVGLALGCSVNDVLVAAATGAIHEYLVEQGEDVQPDLEIRATIPVNLRPLEHAADLGNRFGLVFLPLPVGEYNPLKRLYRINAAMNELKASKQAAMSFGLLAALGVAPSFVQKPALDAFSRKASTVLTNVPGPQRPLYMAGSKIREMMFWVPQNGSIGLGISILSYNGQVFFGLIADRLRIENPAEVISRFRSEFNKLLYAAMLGEPGERPCPEASEGWLDEAVARFRLK